MISVTIVVLLLIIAIALILAEIFLLPGVGIAGISGVICMLVALYLGYTIDVETGHYTLAATATSSVVLIWLSLRSKTWERMSQKEAITSHVDHHTDALHVGDRGTAISRLNPIGSVRFGEEIYEATSRGEYLDAQSEVEIVNIEANKITVKQIQ